MKSTYKDTIIRIAEGYDPSMRRATNADIKWGDFCQKMSQPLKFEEDYVHYLNSSKADKTKNKKQAGWLVAGEINGDIRNNTSTKNRCLITIDCDNLTPDTFNRIQSAKSGIAEFEFFAHTTRSHQPDTPRLRIFLLLSAPLMPKKYEAVARIIAQKIDPTMESVDPISFRVCQMMFNPSISRNQDFLHWHNDGAAINADELLKTCSFDWQDRATYPRGKGAGVPHQSDYNPQNPKLKKGWIGAFCSIYSIEQAIAKFLPTIYVSKIVNGRDVRYTYAKGSTASGAVVQDGGVRLYSFHSTDPCAETLVNAFDLVRRNLFGELDEGVELGDKPSSWPSYKAMVNMLHGIPAVKAKFLNIDTKAMIADAKDSTTEPAQFDPFGAGDDDVFSDADEESPFVQTSSPPDDSWIGEKLKLDDKQNIMSTLTNIAQIIHNDPRTYGKIALNAFSQRLVARANITTKLPLVPKVIVKDKINGDNWDEYMDLTVMSLLDHPRGEGEAGWGIHRIKDKIYDATRMVGKEWEFHPVKEYYDKLKWDGTHRIEELWIKYMGTPDNAYYRETAVLFMLAAIARIYNPGHKWDHTPIIRGEQGIRKSSFIKALFSPGWAGELTAEMTSNKEALEQMFGSQVLELPELANLRAGQVSQVKAFLTREKEVIRLTWERRVGHYPRQCIFVGTTNEVEYLSDISGNRRYWPIEVSVDFIDTDDVILNRPQLWAEALVRWRDAARQAGNYKKIVLKLSDEAEAIAKQLQNNAREESQVESRSAMINRWLNEPVRLHDYDLDAMQADPSYNPLVLRVRTTAMQTTVEALELTTNQAFSKSEITKTGHALQLIKGWQKSGRKINLKKYGVGHEHILEDATKEELACGYRILPDDDDRPNPADFE